MSIPAPHAFERRARLLDFMRQADVPGLINLAAGIPGKDALPSAALRRAFERATDRDADALFAYHHPEGDHRLRQILAERLQQRGVKSLRGEQIVTTTGCTQALQLMISLLVRPGAVVACEAPAYYGMLELLSAAQAKVLPLPTNAHSGLDFAKTAEALAQHRPDCLIVCPTLSNPSGATIAEEQRKPLVELCRSLRIRIIEDDIYAELADAGAPTPLLAHDPEGEVVSYVTSFSKSVSPGLRVGFAVPGTLHESFAELKCRQDLHSCVVGEGILREFLEAHEMDPHLEWLRSRNARRRSLALEAARCCFPADARIAPPLGGYMLWAELPSSVDIQRLRKAALSLGVAFAAGDVFFTEDTPFAAMRLNCARASETDLVRGIETLGQLLRS